MNIFTSNTKYLPYIQVITTFLVLLFIFYVPQSVVMWVISLVIYAVIGCFGISIGYHRYLTHRSFKLTRPWEIFCTICGMLAFTGSSIGWVGVHRQHHRYSDKPGDPHSPIQAGIKILIAGYYFEPNKWAVRSLIVDKFHAFIHRYYFAILSIWSIFWLMFGLSFLFYIVLIPAAISVWVSTISNYVNHRWGYRNYNTNDSSTNNWVNAIFTFGEGWHNNHHTRPKSYTFKVKWWEFDLGALIINLIRK